MVSCYCPLSVFSQSCWCWLLWEPVWLAFTLRGHITPERVVHTTFIHYWYPNVRHNHVKLWDVRKLCFLCKQHAVLTYELINADTRHMIVIWTYNSIVMHWNIMKYVCCLLMINREWAHEWLCVCSLLLYSIYNYEKHKRLEVTGNHIYMAHNDNIQL